MASQSAPSVHQPADRAPNIVPVRRDDALSGLRRPRARGGSYTGAVQWSSAGSLEPVPALDRLDIMPHQVAAALAALDPDLAPLTRVAEIDPDLAAPAAFCRRYCQTPAPHATRVFIKNRTGPRFA